ncbi:MAG: hypothetical protein MI866_01065, partial [Bacteroidales bacterium]|nr:hypothetical protein [Bacteroidales bacterium]
KAASLEIYSDKSTLNANGYDVAHIIVQLMDDMGNPVIHQEEEVTFMVNGDVKPLGVDNGNGYSLPTYQSNKITTANGRALLLIQSQNNATNATISAQLPNGAIANVDLQVK